MNRSQKIIRTSIIGIVANVLLATLQKKTTSSGGLTVNVRVSDQL